MHTCVNASSKNQAFGAHPSLHLPKAGVSAKCVSDIYIVRQGYIQVSNLGNSPHLIVPSD